MMTNQGVEEIRRVFTEALTDIFKPREIRPMRLYTGAGGMEMINEEMAYQFTGLRRIYVKKASRIMKKRLKYSTLLNRYYALAKPNK